MARNPEVIETAMGRTEEMERQRLGGRCFSRFISANLWDTVSRYGVSGTPERKTFSYNKRTMDRAMGPF